MATSTPVALASAVAVSGVRRSLMSDFAILSSVRGCSTVDPVRLKREQQGIAAQPGSVERGDLWRQPKYGPANEFEAGAGDPASGQYLESVDQSEGGGAERSGCSDDGWERAQRRSIQ